LLDLAQVFRVGTTGGVLLPGVKSLIVLALAGVIFGYLQELEMSVFVALFRARSESISPRTRSRWEN
jgi:hypothetical protein